MIMMTLMILMDMANNKYEEYDFYWKGNYDIDLNKKNLFILKFIINN